jgi:hypothetical protein
MKNRFIKVLIPLLLTAFPLLAGPMDLASVKCGLPWEQFTTESNTPGILFEDKTDNDKVFFLPMTNVPYGNFTVEMQFTMSSFLGSDRSSL